MELKNDITVKDFLVLHEALGWKLLQEKEVKKSIKHSMFKVSAIENGQTVGIARIVGDYATHGLLSDVIVLPEFQGKGIGKAMITHLYQQCQEFANKHDEFIVELLPTAGKHEFYVKCGFKHAPDMMEGCYKWFKNQHIYSPDCKKHVMRLNPEPFKSIKSGKKTIEMRLYDDKRQKIKKGDIIVFVDRTTGKTLRTKVEDLHIFKNFDELYGAFDKTMLGYRKKDVANPNDMEKYYSKEEQSKFGVVGIQIKEV